MHLEPSNYSMFRPMLTTKQQDVALTVQGRVFRFSESRVMFVDKLTSVALAFKVDESRTASGPSVLIRCRSSIFGLEVESGVAAAVSDSCLMTLSKNLEVEAQFCFEHSAPPLCGMRFLLCFGRLPPWLP